jgi:molybdopterin-guanine dinucleotide biosynthesis protein A
MGTDKATMTVTRDGEMLATRTGRLLAAVTDLALEVGPGHSDLPSFVEPGPGGGPLSALAAGQAELRARGWNGPALVVATDLPRLTPGLLGWLAGHPSPRSIVPVAGDIPQTLCARYRPTDLQRASALTAAGRRSMRDLLADADVLLVGPAEWQAAAGDPDALADCDTPFDVARLGLL